MAACLSMGPCAAASHRSAAALLELSGFGPTILEISCVVRRKPRPRVHVHRVPAFVTADLTTCGPIPTTTPARTLLDLGGVVSFERLEVALDDALHRGIVTLPRLRWQLQRAGKKGRPGTAALRLALEARSRGYVAAESALETRVLRLIADAGLPPPVRQYRLRQGGRVQARVDLAYPHSKVAIEADGYRYHSARVDWQRDRRVQNLLTVGGWLLLRITWEDVERRPEQVAAEIRAALSHRFSVT
jgi:very-short-patch-repair endonuclease